MPYVDGFVLPVPTRHLAEYRRISRAAGKVWREHGALQYVECAGEDMKAKGVMPFTAMIERKRGETIVFAWIMFKSRAHRDRINKKVMADPQLAEMMSSTKMPFDTKRMVYGGFEVMVDV